MVSQVQGNGKGRRIKPSLGPLLPRVQAHQQAVTVVDDPGVEVREPSAFEREIVRAMRSGELRARRSRRVRRKRDDRGVRAYDARHHVETTPTKATHSRQRWERLRVLTERPRGFTTRRARDAALRVSQLVARQHAEHVGAGFINRALRGCAALAEQRFDRVGSQLRHFTRAHSRAQGRAQSTA